MNPVLKFLVIILLYSCQEQNTSIRYRLLDDAGSGELVILDQIYKKPEEVAGSPYIKEVLDNNILIRREQFNRIGELMDHDYSPAIVEFHYNASKTVEKVTFRNKDGEKVNLNFGGYNSIVIDHDVTGRIKSMKYFDKTGEPMQWTEGIDMKPPVVKYTYRGGNIYAQYYDKRMVALGEPYKVDTPCIPYMNYD